MESINLYAYFKALHIISFVSWFAGLFYIVRLFIYHVEAEEKPKNEKEILQDQLLLMQGRLWKIITIPAMVATVIFGLLLLWWVPSLLHTLWFNIKLALLAGLLAYHFKCGHIHRLQKSGKNKWTSTQLRLWNEVATLFLVAIVFLAVLKNATDFVWGFVTIIILGFILTIAVKLYKKKRLNS